MFKEIKNDVALIKPHCRLMGERETKILNKILLDIQNNSLRACIIDFSSIKWINTPEITCLIKRKNNFRKSGKDLRIININNNIKDYLHLTKLSEYFQ